MTRKTRLSEEARDLAPLPLFGQLDEQDLTARAEKIDQIFFNIKL
jgi:hypothetical protein